MFQSSGIHGPVLGPVGSLVVDLVLLGVVFWCFLSPDMRRIPNVITLVSLVAGISLMRVLMAPLPNIQPVSVAAILVGAQLGVRRGISFAILVSLTSNLFLGDGIWTLYQALGWSTLAVIGSASGIVKNNQFNLKTGYIVSVLSAFLFGIITSLSVIGTVSLVEFYYYWINGLPYDLLHGLGNLTFMAWTGAWFNRQLSYQQQLENMEQRAVETYAIRT